MKQQSNIRNFRPKSEATKLLTVFQQIQRPGQLGEVSPNASLQEVSRAFSAPHGLTTNQGFDGHSTDHRASSADPEARPSGTVDEYNATDDFAKSIDEAYAAVRERMRDGGPGWTPK